MVLKLLFNSAVNNRGYLCGQTKSLKTILSYSINNNSQIFNNINNCNSRQFSLSTKYLTDRRFTEKHEWILIDGEIGVIGISNYAQESLGDVVFAQLPNAGQELSRGDECGALESVKAASELYSPVSGCVTEKNVNVEETPSLINSSCYDKGWLFKVKLSKMNEMNKLMSETDYMAYLKSESH